MSKHSIQEYQKEWDENFVIESKKIRDVLNDSIQDIQHIGSTSIPGMIAKPIIDIAVLVDSITTIPFFTKKLETLGYSYEPDMSSTERIFFRKGSPVRYHLSITSPLHTFWDRNIIFRDHLKKHPDLIEEYKKLKIENISITPEEDFKDLSLSKIYNEGKGDFVQKVLNLANFNTGHQKHR